jgi:hypothetical protein
MSLNKNGIQLLQSLDSIKLVSFNPKIQCKIENLGYHSIKQLEVLSKKRWEEYYKKGGRIYLQKYTTKLPFSKRVVFDKIALKYLKKGTPKPLKPKKVKRSYVKGSLGGKANGLNLYIQKNDKLTKKDRNKLLKLSEIYISNFNQNLPISQHYNYLDPSLSDIENLEIWNNFFQSVGYYFEDLRKRWEMLFLENNQKNQSILIDEDKPNFSNHLSKKTKYVDWGI